MSYMMRAPHLSHRDANSGVAMPLPSDLPQRGHGHVTEKISPAKLTTNANKKAKTKVKNSTTPNLLSSKK
jgi:hypothetical protein